MRIVYRILIRTERKIPLGRPGHRSEDNLKLILMYGGLVWIQTGSCEHGGVFFFCTKLMVVCFLLCSVCDEFEVFWDFTPCQLVNS